MQERRLLGLRAMTTKLRELPGMVILLDYVRRHYAGHATPIVVSDFDRSIRLELRLDEHMESQIFWYGSYSREVLHVLDCLLLPGMVVVDAGANIGEVSLFAAKRVAPSGWVFGFEPVPRLAERLRRNSVLNGFQVLETVEMGLADRRGEAEIFAPQAVFKDGTWHGGLATLYPQVERATPVATIKLTTLDAFLRDRAVPRLDLLKVDVEGAELPLLRGASEALKRWQPWLLLEIQAETSTAAGYGQAEILSFLEGFGYSFARFGRGGRLEPLSSANLADFQNVLGIPAGRSVIEVQ